MVKKSFLLYASVGLILAFVIASRPVQTFAEAEQLRLGLISQNCSSIKIQLRQIQKNDTKNRVQLGSYYESITSDLMLNLNLRLVKNGIAVPELATLQTDFTDERERFRNDYIGYSQELESLLAIDCRANPAKFSTQLEKTRNKRIGVYESIWRLNEILDKHTAAIDALKESL